MPLSELSAFWGENYINLFKKLVKSPNKPLTQIVNRLSELESRKTFKIREKRCVDNCIFNHSNSYFYEEEKYINIISVDVNSFVLKCVHPDNVIQLNDNRIIKIDAIFIKKENTENKLKPQDFYILGYQLDNPRDTFNYPTASKVDGITTGTQFLEHKEMFALKDIRCKCMLLRITSFPC